jgi:hypothetical protein
VSQSETQQCVNPTSEESRHPHKPTLLKRETARTLAHVDKIESHYDTAACNSSDCCRNVSRNRHSPFANADRYLTPVGCAEVRSTVEIRHWIEETSQWPGLRQSLLRSALALKLTDTCLLNFSLPQS